MRSIRLVFCSALLLLGSTTLATTAAIGATPSTPAAKPGPGTVRLFINRTGQGQAMDVRNELDVPVEVVVRLNRMVNVSGVGKGVVRRTVPANSRLRLATLRKRDAAYPLMYKHSFSYSLVYSPEPDQPNTVDGPVYALPWRGGPFHVSQGAGGDFSHSSPRGRYAVDIAMPVGTPIVAARLGTVLKVRNGQGGRLPDPAGNYVRVVHDDGTHAAYLHLQRGSVQVKPGQRVEVGSLLGKSGNTGRSTGPHLHFVVQQSQGDTLLSIPFRFAQPVSSVPDIARND